MVYMRLGLLESFMYEPETQGRISSKSPKFEDSRKGKAAAKKWEEGEDSKRRAALGKATIWSFESGTLTIVDLSCPFVDENAACALFNIAMALFLEERGTAGRIIALDEAHKAGLLQPGGTLHLLMSPVHDWHRVRKCVHRDPTICHTPAAAFSNKSHHCHTRTHHLTRIARSELNDNCSSLHIPFMAESSRGTSSWCIERG